MRSINQPNSRTISRYRRRKNTIAEHRWPGQEPWASYGTAHVYGKVKDLLARRSREPAEHVPAEPLTLADPQCAIVIQLPASLATTEAAGLANVRLPERTQTSWVYVRYDPRTRRWQATLIPQPPPNAIEVIPPDGDTTTP